MADYAFRTLEQRQKIENLWAANTAPKKIAEEMEVSETLIYTELRRGRDGARLKDGRLRYNAAAQLKVAQSLEKRGRKITDDNISNGTEAGVVLGRPWSGKTKPPEGAAGLYRKDLARTPGEAMIRYKGGTLTIKAAKVVEDGYVEVTGNLTANGNLTVAGTITAQSVTTSGDVVAGGKSLIGHTHTDSQGGGTSAPK